VSKNTQSCYRTAVSSYKRYCKEALKCEPVFPCTVSDIIYFVAWLHQQSKSSNTVATYLAGLSQLHQARGWHDPMNHFLIKKVLKGSQHLSGKPDIRLPITPQILFQLVSALKSTVQNKFNRQLLSAMFTINFFAFLRIGEIAAKSTKERSNNIIQVENISLESLGNNSKFFTLTLRHFKHHDSCRPVCLQILRQSCKKICPVRHISKYLKSRGSANGPLFLFCVSHGIAQL
jgi:hypothetical protein